MWIRGVHHHFLLPVVILIFICQMERSLDFSIDLSFSCTMAMGVTQPLTDMSTRNHPGGKGQPAHDADFTAICEPTV
jgi:hypothetical protein